MTTNTTTIPWLDGKETLFRPDPGSPAWEEFPKVFGSNIRYFLVPRTQARWTAKPNPHAGTKESAWLRMNSEEVANEAEPWVAILRNSVKARAASFQLLFEKLRDLEIHDALVACVRPRVRRPHRIA